MWIWLDLDGYRRPSLLALIVIVIMAIAFRGTVAYLLTYVAGICMLIAAITLILGNSHQGGRLFGYSIGLYVLATVLTSF